MNLLFKHLVQAIYVLMILLILPVGLIYAHGEKKHVKSSENWQVPSSVQHMKNPISQTKASIQKGRSLFEEKCSGCHGFMDDDPSGFEEDGAPFYKMLSHLPAGEMYWKIKTGRGDMPAWENRISIDNMWNITNYLKSLK